MSHIVSIADSIARPSEPLFQHLIHVKKNSENFSDHEDPMIRKLAGVAGLCHDLGKNHIDWQRYIRFTSIKKGPNHSDCGAFFFSLLGYEFLNRNSVWKKYQKEWLYFVRDIADHHGQLKNLDEREWIKRYDWAMFDLDGIGTIFRSQYQEFSDLTLTIDKLESWVNDVDDLVEDVEDSLDLGYDSYDSLELMIRLQKWRQLTTGLISGDRFDVKSVSNKLLPEKGLLDSIEKYCKGIPLDNPLARVRQRAQGQILYQMKQVSDEKFFTVNMPTGYGKTLVSLKMAAWFSDKLGYSKLIYVAPYLSILTQNSLEIKKATGIIPLEHHSLAIVGKENQRTENSQLAMESWAHSIVSTSFQQLWKAIFPKRAQDVLRRSFLKKCVLIIDEPQILNSDIWNLFLCGLEALSELLDLKVIFLSATMPPFDYGLSKSPASLQVVAKSNNDRYDLIVDKDNQDEHTVAKQLLENEYTSQAAILNTIEDAYRVYKELDNEHTFLIHGLMIPIHKKMMIRKIQDALADSSCSPLYVVSTQILEAGVNMSFEHIERALPILPSIVQAAGRVNRHLEHIQKGTVRVFPFYRGGEKDTRSYIYEKALQKITDRLLGLQDSWTETELIPLVKIYYQQMFAENTRESAMESIRDACEGRWKELTNFQPFAKDFLTLPLFIPWEPEANFGELPEDVLFLQNEFNLSGPYDIYNRFQDKNWMESQDITKRKMFMILFHYYVLDLPIKKAFRVASQEEFLDKKIPILQDPEAYNSQLGFKTAFEDYDSYII